MVQITEIMTSTRSVHPTRKPGSSGLGVTIVMPPGVEAPYALGGPWPLQNFLKPL